MTNHSEIKNIIQESVSQILEEKSRDKKNKVIEIMGVILTPVVIASVSLLVTYEINKSQAINARTIANAQIESAKSMAEAQRDHTARLAEAELEVQRLKQIDNIFQKIIKNGKSSVDTETKKMLIGSLTTHRETSLPFWSGSGIILLAKKAIPASCQCMPEILSRPF